MPPTAWGRFCLEWNGVLSRRPTAVVIFFSGMCTLTWAITFAALSVGAAGSALSAPEFAVGWLLMRATMRPRIPLNLALAAPLSRLVPALSLLKISPLLASFNTDAETKAKLKAAWEEFEQSPKYADATKQRLRSTLDGAARFARWAEGPIDKYGLSYFIVSKVSNVSTLAAGAAAAAHGLDVASLLSTLGLSGELQGDSGLLACTVAVNVGFTPLHFLGAVRSVVLLENFGSRMWAERQRELLEKQREPEGLSEEELEQLELTECQMRTTIVGPVSALVLMFDLGFALFIMRRLYRSQTATADPATGGGEAAVADGDSGAAAQAASTPVARQPPVPGASSLEDAVAIEASVPASAPIEAA